MHFYISIYVRSSDSHERNTRKKISNKCFGKFRRSGPKFKRKNTKTFYEEVKGFP
jgi:hypothetical protein